MMQEGALEAGAGAAEDMGIQSPVDWGTADSRRGVHRRDKVGVAAEACTNMLRNIAENTHSPGTG